MLQSGSKQDMDFLSEKPFKSSGLLHCAALNQSDLCQVFNTNIQSNQYLACNNGSIATHFLTQ